LYQSLSTLVRSLCKVIESLLDDSSFTIAELRGLLLELPQLDVAFPEESDERDSEKFLGILLCGVLHQIVEKPSVLFYSKQS
jgi:hypothetical protein